MSKAREQQAEEKEKRISVGNLPQPVNELSERETENIKGGGGVPGGVVMKDGTQQTAGKTVQ